MIFLFFIFLTKNTLDNYGLSCTLVTTPLIASKYASRIHSKLDNSAD